MTAAPDMAERHSRTLARLAELSLALAEDVQAAALAAEAPAQKAELADSFHRVARSVRQSVALEAKLARDAERAAAVAEAEAAGIRARKVEARRTQVRAQIERRVFTELADRKADLCMADCDERLETEALDAGFLDEDVDAQVTRLAMRLGLTGEAAFDYVPRAFRSERDTDPPFDWSLLCGDMADDDDDEDDDDDDDDGDFEDEADDGDEPAPAPPEPPAPVITEPPPPPPDPPPEPPPEPYIPPWERLRPGERFPGGSGW